MARGAFSSPRPLRGSSPEFFSSGGVKPKRLQYISSDNDQSRSHEKKSRTISQISDFDDYGVYEGRRPSPVRKKPKYGAQQESYGIASKRKMGQSGRGFAERHESPGRGSRPKLVGSGSGDRQEGPSRSRYDSMDSGRGLHNASDVSKLKRKALSRECDSESDESEGVPSREHSSDMVHRKTRPAAVGSFRSFERTMDESDSDEQSSRLPSSSRRLNQLPAACAASRTKGVDHIILSSDDEDELPSRGLSPVRRPPKHKTVNPVGSKIAAKSIDEVRAKRPAAQKKKAAASVVGATSGTILFRADDSRDTETPDRHPSPPRKLVQQNAVTASNIVQERCSVESDNESDDLPPPRLPPAKKPALQKSKTAVAGSKSAAQRGCKILRQGDITIRPEAYHYLRKDEWEGSGSDDEREDCRLCGKIDNKLMLECDDCLDGFHLRCLKPPLTEVPEGDWFCPFCEKRRRGETVEQQAARRNRHRTARERLLAGELSAVQILKIWKGPDSRAWVKCRRYIIPEETIQGRRPENGRRELFRTSIIEDIEAKRVHRECYIYVPEEFAAYQSCAGSDDCFVCGHHYDDQCHTFTRISDETNPCQAVRRDNSDDELSDTGSGSSASDEADHCESEDDSSRHKAKRKSPVSRNNSATQKRGLAKTCEILKSSRVLSKPGNSVSQNFQVKSKTVKPISRKSQGTVKGANKQIVPYGGTTEMVVKRDKPKVAGTEFGEAKSALKLAAAPACFPCRDKERAEITMFLTGAVAAGDKCLGRSLYISGVPGTGKTALVEEVIHAMQKKAKSGELPKFSYVPINALKLQSPEHIFGFLYRQLTGQMEKNKTALELLNKLFSQPRSGKEAIPCVVVIDELDSLVNRNQTELYNLFNWPSLANSRLVVIGIANIMDLPERVLPRIASRMGQRISFAPYTYTQLQEIITARLEGLQVFDKQALELASRKVSANSGDARMALQLCRRAVELAEQRLATAESATPTSEQGMQGRLKNVGMIDVTAAINEKFQTPSIQMMKSCAKHAKIFLAAMVYEERKSNMTEVTFEKIAEAVRLICQSNGEESPDTDTLIMIGSRLGACRLLLAEPSAKHRLQKLQLNCSRDDVSLALSDDKEVFWLKKFLPETK